MVLTVAEATARPPYGNPSTMAFLGVRNKSSAARIHAEDDVSDAAEFGGVGAGRTVHEAWMVNLGRGDEKWLTGPRGGDWFTGKAPDVCPGEFHI